MLPYLADHYGNPSSQHSFGWKAKMAVEKARTQVAKLFHCQNNQVIFTSGATESIHTATIGWLLKQKNFSDCTLITSQVEHKATFGAFKFAEKLGAKTIKAPVLTTGQIAQDQLLELIPQNSPVFVSLIHGHNEIGSLNPIEQIGQKLQNYPHVTFHVDAAQSAGKVDIEFEKLKIDMLSVSAHKLYGPKGIGCLLLKDINHIEPLFTGGGQEQDLRAGTLNVPAIVGFGATCEWLQAPGAEHIKKLKAMRDNFIKNIQQQAPSIKINGHLTERLPHNINLTIPGVTSDEISDSLSGIAFSGSSACSSTSREPSHTLSAIGLSSEDARSSFRLGLGIHTQPDDMEIVLNKILKLAGE